MFFVPATKNLFTASQARQEIGEFTCKIINKG